MWIYVAFAIGLFVITLATAIGLTSVFQHRQKIIRRIRQYMHQAVSDLERDPMDSGIPMGSCGNEPAIGARCDHVPLSMLYFHILMLVDHTSASNCKSIKFPTKLGGLMAAKQTSNHIQKLLSELTAPHKVESLPSDYSSIQKHDVEKFNSAPRPAAVTIATLELALSAQQRRKLFKGSKKS
jgi:hypothetical protein